MRAIRMGIPEMEALWNNLRGKADSDTLKGSEKKLFKQLVKAFDLLRHDPKYPGLNSHPIDVLSDRYGFKVWQSYLENRTPSAGRLYWTYGPGRNEISILGIEPHPDDKSSSYKRIKLDELPPMS